MTHEPAPRPQAPERHPEPPRKDPPKHEPAPRPQAPEHDPGKNKKPPPTRDDSDDKGPSKSKDRDHR
ncbi:MAG: hypothetical protein KC464_25295 [Myxococcales bacterium]|nr:hypothetical protein [Myxococcales bacterium]